MKVSRKKKKNAAAKIGGGLRVKKRKPANVKEEKKKKKKDFSANLWPNVLHPQPFDNNTLYCLGQRKEGTPLAPQGNRCCFFEYVEGGIQIWNPPFPESYLGLWVRHGHIAEENWLQYRYVPAPPEVVKVMRKRLQEIDTAGCPVHLESWTKKVSKLGKKKKRKILLGGNAPSSSSAEKSTKKKKRKIRIGV